MAVNLQNYRWPAEWEAHEATWVAWPVNPNTWPGLFDRIPAAFARFVAAIARFEPVRVLAGSQSVVDQATELVSEACSAVGSSHPVEFVDIPVNDSWCRDHGPIFLIRNADADGRADSDSSKSVIIDWDYNAWGGKYPPWDDDALVARRVAERLQLPAVQPGIILEGGAIEGDGAGTVLTTTNCLLNPNRNPELDQAAMEAALKQYLQIQHVVWLPGHGIVGDDTDGHIDQVARFVDTERVLVASAYSEDAPEAADLRDNFECVQNSVNSQGSPLQPVALKMPSPKFQQGHRLPACYCNYYLANGAVIVPTFQDDADDAALQLLQDCYPDRSVVPVDALDLIWGLGAFHCMTQQQPCA